VTSPDEGAELAVAARAGDRRALGRLLTLVEDRAPAGGEALEVLAPYAGGAHRVGITGPPGAGKSTLVDALVAVARAGGRAVAVLAIDPSSPITGGAILGDRVRMQRHTGDGGVFIRSMASRGHAGGLAAATMDAATVLDACGFGLVLIETVGTGQGEVAVAALADTTVVVEAPDMGDEIQALKAGLLEVADIVAVSKADRPGADRAAAALRAMLTVGAQHDRAAGDRPRPSRPEVLLVSGQEGTGVIELLAAIDRRAPLREPPAPTSGPRATASADEQPILRRLTPDDDRMLFTIFVTSVTDLAARYGNPWPDLAPTDEQWARWRSLFVHVRRTSDEAWGAELGGRLVGYARSIRRGDTRELTECFVLPGQQGRGIGRALLERAFPADVPHRTVVATFDPAALSRYLRHGLRSTCAALAFEGPPNQEPVPQPGGLIARRVSGVPQPEALVALAIVDRALLLDRRDVDHAWLIADRTGWLLERDDSVVGYAYGGRREGPVAVLDPADLPWALTLVEREAAGQGRDLSIVVPLANQTALDHLAARGYRLDWFTMHLLEDTPRVAFDRYILTSPPFFL
jgi:LAO/AO transport system kinase